MLFVLSGTAREVDDTEGPSAGLCFGLARGLGLGLESFLGLLRLCVWIDDAFLLDRGRLVLPSLLPDCEPRLLDE